MGCALAYSANGRSPSAFNALNPMTTQEFAMPPLSKTSVRVFFMLLSAVVSFAQLGMLVAGFDHVAANLPSSVPRVVVVACRPLACGAVAPATPHVKL